MKPIRIIIADDHRLFVDGLCTIFAEADHIAVAGIAASGEEVMPLIMREEPDIVLLDLSMPGMGGLKAAEQIMKSYPGVNILIVTMNDSADVIRTLIKTGVKGIVFKNTSKQELLLAIDQLYSGASYYSQAVTALLAQNYYTIANNDWQLTKREKEILQLIYEGYTTDQIAKSLFISSYTVDTHKKNLFLKSGFNKSSQLIKRAIELGYIKST